MKFFKEGDELISKIDQDRYTLIIVLAVNGDNYYIRTEKNNNYWEIECTPTIEHTWFHIDVAHNVYKLSLKYILNKL